MVTFLHTADWQLGMTRRWLEPEAQARFDDDRVQAIRRAGRIAREQGCAFVVVAGDVFEHNQLGETTVRRALEAMAEMELPVYLLPGNHDPLDVVSIYRQERFRRYCPGNVTVLDEVGPYEVGDGVEIVAAPWRGKHPEEDLVAAAMAAVPPPVAGTVRLVVGHGATDLFDPHGSRRATVGVDGLRAAASRGEVHYVALGDRHSRTDVGGYGLVWYSGAIEVTDSREEAPGEVLVAQVTAEHEPEVRAFRVGAWSFEEMERDLAGAQDVTDLIDELAARTGKERVVLTLRLRGALTVAQYTRLHDALEGYSNVFAGLREWDQHTDLVVLPPDAEWDDLGLSGFVAQAMTEIRDLSAGDAVGPKPEASTSHRQPGSWSTRHARENDAQSAQDALTLLYRLSGAGRR